MFFLTLFSFLLVFLVVLSVCWYVWHLNIVRQMPNVPLITCVPLLGHALKFLHRRDILPGLSKIFDELGDTFLVVLGMENFILTRDYESLENILNSNQITEKAHVYSFLHNWLARGLLTSEGAKWKRRRRILTPTYHFQILEQFVPIFDSVSDILVKQIKLDKNKGSLDIYPYISLSTLDVISETAMGVKVHALENQESEYVKSVKRMAQVFIDRIFSPIQQIEFLYMFTENYKIEQEALKVLHGHTMSVIRQRRRLLEGQSSDNSQNEDFGIKKRMAFLDMLLQVTENGIPLSDEDIREEVDTFMFEGHDTTASGISFTLFEISRNPDVQRKILEEQRDIFGKDVRPLTYKDLSDMKYLDMVIKESMRLYPPVPFFSRKLNKNFKLNDKTTLPKGISVTVIPYHIHRNPKAFENPDTFIPERFSAENDLGNKPYFFVPFSAGPRNCIGQKFAMLEMKATISKMVRCFELSQTVPPHVLSLTTEMIIKSENGILIQLKERDDF